MPDNGEPGKRDDGAYVPSAETSIWREGSGYWSARVVADFPDRPEWRASATAFHDASDAMQWARVQIERAADAR